MVKEIIEDYLASIESGRIVVPNYGAYIKSEGGEVVFSSLLRIDDGVLVNLIMSRSQCSKEQAQTLIAAYIATQREKKPLPEPPKSDIEHPHKSKVEQSTKSDVPSYSEPQPPISKPYPPKIETRPNSEPYKPAKRRKKTDPLIVVVIVAIACVIGLLIVAYIRNGGQSIGL